MASTTVKRARYAARKAAGATEASATCQTCGESKGASEFRRNWHRPSGLDYNCHDCVSRINRLVKFGLTPQQYVDMLDSQGGVCAICEKPEKSIDPRNGRTKSLAVDHNHSTSEIRGLLCQNCNKGIGNLGDSPERLIAAAAYLIERGSYEGVIKEDG